MIPPMLPEDAAASLGNKVWPLAWSRGVAIEGIGPEATLVLLVTDLLEAQAFIDTIGWRWSGYPVKARGVSS